MDRLYEFGVFQLDPAERLLRKGEVQTHLTPKAFDLLVLLVENHGRLLDKDTILRTIWPDVVVEEATLTQNIATLRKVLGDGNGAGKYIETVPKHGYRFTADVRVVVRDPHPAFWNRRRVIPAVVAAALAIIAGSWMAAARVRTKPVVERSVAILPLKSLSTDPADEYLGLAITDSLITDLSNIRQLTVRPTSAIRNNDGDPVRLGRQLRVNAVVDGTIEKTGERVRISIRLIRTPDGKLLWQERFDVASRDLLDVQERVTEQLARAMIGKASSSDLARAALRPTVDSAAYESYLKGRYFWNKRTEDGFVHAIEHFEAALRRDPNFALAWSGLADAYALLGSMANSHISRSEAMPRARDAALRALQLDRDLAEAHASLAFVRMHYEWDWDSAGREFRRAMLLNPRYATAQHWYAYYCLSLGKFDDAIASIRRAQQLDPLSLIINTDVAEMLFYAGRYDESIGQVQKTLEMDPNFPLAYWILGRDLSAKGDLDAAVRVTRRALDLGRKDQAVVLARYNAQKGDLGTAWKLVRGLEQQINFDCCDTAFAAFYAAVGEKDRAIQFLERAYEQRSGSLILMSVEPEFQSLRSDPRFIDIARRVGVAARGGQARAPVLH